MINVLLANRNDRSKKGNIELPVSREDWKKFLDSIAVGNNQFVIEDVQTDFGILHTYLSKKDNINEMNYLAAILLWEIEDKEKLKYEAALEYGDHTGTIQELINLAQNLDCFCYRSDLTTEADVGRDYLEDIYPPSSSFTEFIKNYINYTALGRDIIIDQECTLTSTGFICSNGKCFTEFYGTIDDMPEEYFLTE